MKSPANPYVGPRAFVEDERLYGRDRELADLMDLLLAERIVLLYSPSGAGKSSLLQAGLIPAMKARGFTVRKVIRVNGAPPAGTAGNRYVMSVMASLQLEGRPADLSTLMLKQYLDAAPSGELLVFDQFEEVLTTDSVNLEAKRYFFEQLGEALRAQGRWALFAMREDFLAALDPYLRYIPTRLSNTFRLQLLSYEASLEAIREPAASVGVKFLDDAVKQIADDLRQVNVPQPDGSVTVELGQFIEPVQLQVVCLRRWEDLAEGSLEIPQSAQPQVGSTALADYYAATVAQVAAASGATERSIRDWFEHSLITKIRTRGQVLQGPQETDGLNNTAVIEPLKEAHLVNSEKRLGSWWLELAHDRLIGPVHSSNETWNRKNLSPLQREAELWRDQGKPEDHLLRKELLAAAEEWARTNKLNSTEEEFLRKSREARTLRRNIKVGAAALVLVLVTLLAWGLRKGATARLYAQQWVLSEVREAEAKRDTQAAREARNRIFFDLLSKVVKFPIEEVLNSDKAPGEVQPTDPAWVTLIGETGKPPFAIARAFGENSEGRVLAIGHEGILTYRDKDGGNDFVEVAMTWLRGAKESKIVLSAKPTDTVMIFPDFNLPALQTEFSNWGYQVETATDLSDPAKLDDAGVLVIGNSWGDFTPQEIDAITNFVNHGGGLLALGLGWSWRDYGPPPYHGPNPNPPPGQPIENYPMNKLFKEFGASWTVNLAK